jgi:hypothetical protein
MMVNKTVSKDSSPTSLVWLPWTISIIVTLLAVLVWAKSLGWQFSGLSAYSLFPVLGLVAFSIMWSHYMTGFLHTTILKGVELHDFFRFTGYAVLVLILLHPGLLIYKRFRDGFGLPPGSYESYVAPSMAWLTLLGSVCLLAFLSFELKRWFENRNWWKYILLLNDAAMLGIFYHGLRLGSQTHIQWFKYIWWFYGITLVAVLLRSYVVRIQQHSLSNS